MNFNRSTAAAVAVLALVGSIAAPASAHYQVKSTSPKSGGSASKSLNSVSVTFTGPIKRGTIRVLGPGNRVVSSGSGARDPRNIARVRVGLKSGLRSGSYSAKWSVISADGHQQTGSFKFRIKG